MSGTQAGISRIRVVIGTCGGLVALFGVARLVSETAGSHLLVLALWLIGALVLHDAVLSPVILGIGAVLRRVPARARGYVQGALVAGGLVTVVAVPLIARTGSQPAAEVIVDQDFPANLTVLLALIALTAVVGYLTRVVREHRTPDLAARRHAPPQAQGSPPAE